MSTREYCVYNETRANLLTPRVTIIDTRSDPLRAVKVLIEGLIPGADTALWLNPLKSVPAVPRLSAYDLVYLDHEGCVVHGIELAPDDEVPHIDIPAASALLLPFRTFHASHVQPGDRIVVCPADEAHLRPLIPAALPALFKPPAVQPAAQKVLTPIPPLAWSAPSIALDGVHPAETQPAPAKPRFPLLHSLTHLRIRIQISITTTAPSQVPAAVTPNSGAQPAEPGARNDSQSSWARQLSASTFTALRYLSGQAASFVRRQGRSFSAAYLRWAETFVFRPARSVSRPSYRFPRLGRHIVDFIFPR